MIEIYAVNKKTGVVLSSSLYSEADLKEIFGQKISERLLGGKKVHFRKDKFFRQEAVSFDGQHPEVGRR